MPDQVSTSSRHAAATRVKPNVRMTRQFTLYTRRCSRPWLASTTYSLIAPSLPAPSRHYHHHRTKRQTK